MPSQTLKTNMSVSDVLETDSKYRYTGVVDDIFTLDDMDSNKDWDYSLPTLISGKSDRRIDIDNKGFVERFYQNFPYLKNVDFSNILIAGGTVGYLMTSSYYSSEYDIDMFLYGLNKDQAKNRINKIMSEIINEHKNYETERNKDNKYFKYNPKINATRNSKCVTLSIDRRKFQIIFRLYKSISEILHGFDLGSSAVGFDGQTVYLTTLSKFSYEYMCNIVDTTRRSTSYEFRLHKYFERGFKMILPKFDVTKLKLNNLKFGVPEVCNMPYFVFSYNYVNGNKISLSKFLKRYCNMSKNGKKTFSKSDYDYENIDRSGASVINIKNLLSGSNDIYYYAEGDLVSKIMDIEPVINDGIIENFYDDLRKKIYTPKKLYIGDIQKYIVIDTLENIVKKLFDENTNKKEYLDNLVKKQKDEVKKKMLTVLGQGINWITENPGTQQQLTSSFNPIIEDESQWYGEYYSSNVVESPNSDEANSTTVSTNNHDNYNDDTCSVSISDNNDDNNDEFNEDDEYDDDAYDNDEYDNDVAF
jgi:hypothetical protein